MMRCQGKRPGLKAGWIVDFFVFVLAPWLRLLLGGARTSPGKRTASSSPPLSPLPARPVSVAPSAAAAAATAVACSFCSSSSLSLVYSREGASISRRRREAGSSRGA